MDLLSFIRTVDPTKVRIGERKYGEDEPKILETTVGRVVSLLSVAPDRFLGELKASVHKLFDEGGSGEQVEQGHSASGEQGVGIQPVSEGEGIVAEDAAPLQPRRKKKRKTAAVDDGEPSHLVKRLRDDQGTPCGTFVGGKSTSAVHRLLVGAVRYAEVCGEAIPTLPFVSATPERGGEGHTESVTGPNLRAISAPQRFVISSDSSHHSSANITEAEVDSFVKLFVPVRDEEIRSLNARLLLKEAMAAEAIRLQKFYPHLLTTISGCRWLLTHGMELAVVKCLNSHEYLSVLGTAIGKAIDKGMQEGLAACIISKSHKDSSIEAVMDILRLDEPLAEKLNLNELQPNMIKDNIANHRSALRDVFVSLVEPFSADALMGTEGTFSTVSATADTTAALSITIASASIITPIFVDDYKATGTDNKAAANENVCCAFVISYGPSYLGPSFPVSSARLASLLRYTRSTSTILSVGMPISSGMTASVPYINENGVSLLLSFIIFRLRFALSPSPLVCECLTEAKC
nr:hypothetical protein [Tanacetum cinerariifolium]